MWRPQRPLSHVEQIHTNTVMSVCSSQPQTANLFIRNSAAEGHTEHRRVSQGQLRFLFLKQQTIICSLGLLMGWDVLWNCTKHTSVFPNNNFHYSQKITSCTESTPLCSLSCVFLATPVKLSLSLFEVFSSTDHTGHRAREGTEHLEWRKWGLLMFTDAQFHVCRCVTHRLETLTGLNPGYLVVYEVAESHTWVKVQIILSEKDFGKN